MADEVTVTSPTRSVGQQLSAFAWRLWYGAWRVFLTALCRYVFRLKIEGREHEPRQGPFIAAVNHASAIDPLFAGIALTRRVYMMAKHDLFSIPLVSAWFRSIGGAFPVRRGEPDRKALRRAIQILEQGEVLLMFPEGTRSPDGRLQEAEPGAALIALRTGTPILPVALVGTHRFLPKSAWWPRLVPVSARLGPPLTVPRIEGHLDHQVLERWGRRIIEEIAKLMPPDQGGTSTEEQPSAHPSA